MLPDAGRLHQLANGFLITIACHVYYAVTFILLDYEYKDSTHWFHHLRSKTRHSSNVTAIHMYITQHAYHRTHKHCRTHTHTHTFTIMFQIPTLHTHTPHPIILLWAKNISSPCFVLGKMRLHCIQDFLGVNSCLSNLVSSFGVLPEFLTETLKSLPDPKQLCLLKTELLLSLESGPLSPRALSIEGLTFAFSCLKIPKSSLPLVC